MFSGLYQRQRRGVGTDIQTAEIEDGAVTLAKLSGGVGLDNRLINGEFRIWQRGTSLSAQADDSYGAMGDRWYILTQTDTIAGARQANPFGGATHSGQITQSQASAQRIGAAQIIEGKNCVDLRGQAVTFYGRFKTSADQDIRVAILEWTGTEDSVTSDVVNDWTSTDYGEGAARFFVDTSITITAVKEYALPGTGWVDFEATGTVSSSCNNIVVFLWTEGTAAQNVTLSMANCGLIRGSAAPAAHAPRQFTYELTLCQRYYAKSFALDTTPAQSVGLNNAHFAEQYLGGGLSQELAQVVFPVVMRAAPSVTLYNPSAANAEVRSAVIAADCTATTLYTIAERNLRIVTTNAAGSVAGQVNIVHWSAVSEL